MVVVNAWGGSGNWYLIRGGVGGGGGGQSHASDRRRRGEAGLGDVSTLTRHHKNVWPLLPWDTMVLPTISMPHRKGEGCVDSSLVHR